VDRALLVRGAPDGRPTTGNPQFVDEPEDAEMLVDGIPLARLLKEYDAQCAISNEIVAAHSLDDIGRNRDFKAGPRPYAGCCCTCSRRPRGTPGTPMPSGAHRREKGYY
jgi:hypothetical protein